MSDQVTRHEFDTLQEQVNKTCGKVDLVLTNHLPHINENIAALRGGISALKWMIGIGLTLIGLILTAISIYIALQ